MTQYYIGVKIIEAWPEEKDGNLGYAVKYPDGYVSWSPKDVFESAYFPMGEDPTKVTPEMVGEFMPTVETRKFDEKTVLCKGIALTGFNQIETSSCVDPANFDMVIGQKACVRRIQETIWKCLGFVVQWGRFGLKQE